VRLLGRPNTLSRSSDGCKGVDRDGGRTTLYFEAQRAASGQRRRLGSPLGFRPEVRKTPSWPRSWANFSRLLLYSHWNAWANLHLLGRPDTFLAPV
jgi:hypothetical protein